MLDPASLPGIFEALTPALWPDLDAFADPETCHFGYFWGPGMRLSPKTGVGLNPCGQTHRSPSSPLSRGNSGAKGAMCSWSFPSGHGPSAPSGSSRPQSFAYLPLSASGPGALNPWPHPPGVPGSFISTWAHSRINCPTQSAPGPYSVGRRRSYEDAFSRATLPMFLAIRRRKVKAGRSPSGATCGGSKLQAVCGTSAQPRLLHVLIAGVTSGGYIVPLCSR